jgi:hypothetical protein
MGRSVGAGFESGVNKGLFYVAASIGLGLVALLWRSLSK